MGTEMAGEVGVKSLCGQDAGVTVRGEWDELSSRGPFFVTRNYFFLKYISPSNRNYL